MHSLEGLAKGIIQSHVILVGDVRWTLTLLLIIIVVTGELFLLFCVPSVEHLLQDLWSYVAMCHDFFFYQFNYKLISFNLSLINYININFTFYKHFFVSEAISLFD